PGYGARIPRRLHVVPLLCGARARAMPELRISVALQGGMPRGRRRRAGLVGARSGLSAGGRASWRSTLGSRPFVLVVLLLVACQQRDTPSAPADGGPSADGGPTADRGPSADGGSSIDGGDVACTPCVTSADCADACVQYGGDNYCASECSGRSCASTEECVLASSSDGRQVSVCVPQSGTCGGGGGGPRPPGND